MPKDFTLTGQLTVRKRSSGGVQQSQYTAAVPTSFSFDMVATNPNGPAPGSINVTLDGVDVDLSMFTTPGPVEMFNEDATNYVTYGIRAADDNQFHPLGELLPGMPTRLVLSRNLFKEYPGTGTGVAAAANRFHMKATGAPCKVFVGAWEK